MKSFGFMTRVTVKLGGKILTHTHYICAKLSLMLYFPFCLNVKLKYHNNCTDLGGRTLKGYYYCTDLGG